MIPLHPGETVLLERRRHWLPITIQGIFLGIIGIVPLIVIITLIALPSSFEEVAAKYPTQFLFFSVEWMLVVWIIFFISFTNYYLNTLIVTTHRVVDIEQHGLFSRDLSELRFENIEDMHVEINGMIPSLLGFGNISIQTAGEQEEFIVQNIPDPNTVRDLISKQSEVVAQELFSKSHL
jgi:energy-coupling factor transporter transmembrane protein EcfT